MANVLTTDSVVTCSHTGTVSLKGSSKLTIGDAKAILESETGSWSVDSCTKPEDTSKGVTACTKVTTVLTGAAKKLLVGNVPVMLDTLTGVTDEKPPILPPATNLSAQAKQTKLTAS